jgi:hypothetical protein
MAAVTLYRDAIVPVLGFCGTRQECACVMRVNRAWHEAAVFGGFPYLSEIQVNEGQLVAFSNLKWKAPKLVRLHVEWRGDSADCFRMPVSFKRLGLIELSIVNCGAILPRHFNWLLFAMKQIHRLHYRDDKISPLGEEIHLGDTIRAKLANLVELTINGHELYSGMIRGILDCTSVIEVVHIPNVPKVADLEQLSIKPRLRDLQMLGTGPNHEVLERINHLRKLTLRMGITDRESVVRLLGFNRATLQELDVSDLVESLIPIGIGSLGQLQRLRLPLIDPSHMELFDDAAPTLKSLEFAHGISDPSPRSYSGRFVRGLSVLTCLHIHETPVTRAFLAVIGQLKQLKELAIILFETPDVTEYQPLGNLKQLERLQLSGGWKHRNHEMIALIAESCIGLKTFRVRWFHPKTLLHIAGLIQSKASQIRAFGPDLQDLTPKKREALATVKRDYPNVHLDFVTRNF